MIRLFFWIVWGILWIQGAIAAGERNLKALKSAFVLETNKIVFPEFPFAFNPSIVRWDDRILMCFRIRDPLTLSTDQIGMVWLDQQFHPIDKPTILERFEPYLSNPSYAQDPRLIADESELYVVYSNIFGIGPEAMRRVVVGNIRYDGSKFYLFQPQPIFYFLNENPKRQEKNWVPFIYNHQLLLSYSLTPHLVYEPQLSQNMAQFYSSGTSEVPWDWGELRGGTQAQLVDGQYLGFFHSVKALTSVQSENEMMTHYFMGAYTYDPFPPFWINAISPHPIVGNTFYEGPMYKTWKPLRVVFPGGFVFDENYIWVAYGRQDHEIWIVKLDKRQLLDQLKPVTRVE
jgi:predicted GH43/DUF377 family glycosyl hydrolase